MIQKLIAATNEGLILKARRGRAMRRGHILREPLAGGEPRTVLAPRRHCADAVNILVLGRELPHRAAGSLGVPATAVPHHRVRRHGVGGGTDFTVDDDAEYTPRSENGVFSSR